jgi:ribose 5-phosphate isomerase A
MNLKHLAAVQAVSHVTSGMKLGLGTGSTVQFVLDALAERLQNGTLENIVGIPTSEATAKRAQELNIPLTDFDTCPHLDLTIDGADEVSPEFYLIKGLGGALLREKIVAAASDKLLIAIDESKQVAQLGTRSPLPVEVLPLGWNTNLPLFEQLGAQPKRRTNDNDHGTPYVTDNGNFIVDCTFPNGIADPYAVARQLDAQAGVMGHGLFLDMAAIVVVGTPDGAVERTR